MTWLIAVCISAFIPRHVPPQGASAAVARWLLDLWLAAEVRLALSLWL
jgi:hypothetical protein